MVSAAKTIGNMPFQLEKSVTPRHKPPLKVEPLGEIIQVQIVFED